MRLPVRNRAPLRPPGVSEPALSGTVGYAILAGAGLVSAWLNVVAGGGSFLTLPILIFLGYAPTVANATNRVGILVQSASAVADFHRHRALDWRFGLWAALPATAGAVLGAQAALEIGDDAFRRVLAVLMLAMALVTLLTSGPRPGDSRAALRPLPYALGFFAIGIYGGFVQAGVGFLLLAATNLAGLDLLRGNAIKVLCTLLFTPLALAIFALQGKVDWAAGLALAAGSLAGAKLGVLFTLTRAERAVRTVVQLAIAACALRLWFG